MPWPGIIARSTQLAIFVLSAVFAVLLRFEFTFPGDLWVHFGYALPIWVLTKVALFEALGLGRGCWRYISTPELCRLIAAIGAGAVAGAAGIALLAPPGFPRSLYVLDFLVCVLLTSGVRVGFRVAAELRTQRRSQGGQRTFVYGAGAAGVLLVRECRANRNVGFSVTGFIDDDCNKVGTLIQGVRVLGGGEKLPELARRYGVSDILIAIPSASGAQMTRILAHCHSAGLRFRTMPPLSDIIQGRELAKQIREVAVEDLLGRTPVHLEEDHIRAKLQGQVVLVTGAAGSIGSELCRQIARFEPKEIIGYDTAESGLFFLEAEMRESYPHVSFHPEIGSIQNAARITETLRQYTPAVLYHAAAYKHVPLMEQHIFEAAENNILGTYRVALAAAQCGVGDFVMVSSDKAVRPTSIMGATKRIAELIINSLQGFETTFVSVRFGNVLGSSGSVVPIFRQQIAAGGPVRVTHPEMRRYFMTIPEAAQLVLQASTMGKGGEIFVLDMGEPVRIVELAQRMILLSGLRPEQDIRIEFTGIRPGEKLHEELTSLEENAAPTYHPKVRIFMGNGVPEEGIRPHIDLVERLCEARDAAGLILAMKALVPDYNPSAAVLRRILSPVEPRLPLPVAAGRRSAAAAVAANASQ